MPISGFTLDLVLGFIQFRIAFALDTAIPRLGGVFLAGAAAAAYSGLDLGIYLS